MFSVKRKGSFPWIRLRGPTAKRYGRANFVSKVRAVSKLTRKRLKARTFKATRALR